MLEIKRKQKVSFKTEKRYEKVFLDMKIQRALTFSR